jgi:hypothetical protein
MTQELAVTAAQIAVSRVETLTAEVKTIFHQTQVLVLNSTIEMGRRLQELKGILPSGEFSEHCKREFNFSQSSVYNYIRIYDEYGAAQHTLFGAEADSKTLGKLTYSKALLLLAVPADEREDFAEENDVADISVRELKDLLKEREEERDLAQAKADDLNKLSQDAQRDRDKYQRERNDEQKRRVAIERELAELKAKPPQTVKVVDQAAIDIRENRIRALEIELAKKSKVTSEAITMFKGKLTAWQATTNDLLEYIAYGDSTDAEQTKMKNAVLAALAEIREQIEESLENE